MANLIELLPDKVANQIAAGEVVQRPASAIKELMENAIDAGATDVSLIVRDGGKTLIQIIDNGCGMGETDARLCFSRHATSKIKQAKDLFDLHTMGFRGEALASIAAIAQVTLKTRTEDQDIGTQIIIEGGEVKSQEACATAKGTSIEVKNLFYNVPARRNFLKSVKAEMRYILEEFQRIVLSHPEISFSMFHNDNETHRLPKSTFRQRIVNLFGTRYNQRLAPVDEETDIVKISGFLGKPEFAKKTRGEQFFFVNNRFIKSSYLHHAINNAMEGMLQSELHPSYFLFLDVAPDSIDVNIHPTKTEIKFEDEKSIYAILRSTIRRSLGQYNIAPSLDFEINHDYDVSPMVDNKEIRQPVIHVDPNYNPFDTSEPKENKTRSDQSFSSQLRSAGVDRPNSQNNHEHWESIYKGTEEVSFAPNENYATQTKLEEGPDNGNENHHKPIYQMHNKYIMSHLKSGFLIVDQQRAHERILFEKFLLSIKNDKALSQQLLFPQTVLLSPSDLALLKELQEDIEALGFDISEFGENSIEVHGIPYDTPTGELQQIMEDLLEQYKHHTSEAKLDRREQIAKSMAKSLSIKTGKNLSDQEMHKLIDELFACEQPNISPNGKTAVITLSLEELSKRFEL